MVEVIKSGYSKEADLQDEIKDLNDEIKELRATCEALQRVIKSNERQINILRNDNSRG